MADPIAVYGAVTGTAGALAAGWAIYHGMFRDRARLVLDVGLKMEAGPEGPKHMVRARVINRGRRAVILKSASLQFNGSAHLRVGSCETNLLEAASGLSKSKDIEQVEAVLQYAAGRPYGLLIRATQMKDFPVTLSEGQAHEVTFPVGQLQAASSYFPALRGRPVIVFEDATGQEYKKAVPQIMAKILHSLAAAQSEAGGRGNAP